MIDFIRNWIRENREYNEEVLRREREHELRILELDNEFELESKVCHSCETLKTQIEFQNLLIQELTRKDIPEIKTETQDLKPISTTRHIPWTVRRAQLEKQDRELAQKLRSEKEITIENLDSELESLSKSNA